MAFRPEKNLRSFRLHGHEKGKVREKAEEWLRSSSDFFESIALAVGVVVAIVNPFVIQAFLIPSGSMIPTLKVGDRIMADKFVYHIRDPQRGEVIVFRAKEKFRSRLLQTFLDFVKVSLRPQAG